MAICRFGPQSDVFVSVGDNNVLECSACRLNNRETFSTPLRAEMVGHLKEHLAAGHKVPAEAIEELAHAPKW